MPVVRISDDLYRRLQKYAKPLEDSVSDVIERILYDYETYSNKSNTPICTQLPDPFEPE